MEINEQKYRLFDQYLNGELPEEIKVDFEQTVQSNPVLKSEFEDYSIERSLVVNHELLETKELLETFDYSDPGASRKKWLWIFGALITIVGSSYFLLKNHEPSHPKKDVHSEHAIPPTKEPLTQENSKLQVLDSSIALHDKTNAVGTETTPKPKTQEDRSTQNINLSQKPLAKNDPVIDTISTLKKPEVVQNQPQEKQVDCATISWNIQAEKTLPCKNESNGSIEISSTHALSKVIMDETYTNSSDFIFRDLYSGTYSFVIWDDNRCSTEKMVSITDEACLSNDIIIDPSMGTYWSIELQEDCDLTIKNRAGQTVYETFVSPGDIYPGVDRQGNILDGGLYFYELNGPQTSRAGTITLLE